MISVGPILPRWILAYAILGLVFVCPAWSAGSARLTVEAVAAPGNKGVVKVALWKGEDTFLKVKPYREAQVDMADGKATAVFSDLEPGEYAVSTFFDKNNNGIMDRGFIGKPTEPSGFSNDAKGNFGPAKYRDARFELGAQGRAITIHLK